MSLPDSAYTHLADMRICRIINGMWQVSGAHGTIHQQSALDAMLRYHDAGFTTWDLADHYGPAEEFIGLFRARLAARSSADLSHSHAFTKWVPRPGPMPRAIVEQAIAVSRQRMNNERLDMVQFHWWYYRDSEYLSALRHMMALQHEGQIRHVALTNFDSAHLAAICAGGIRILSNQIQYSLIDRRPEQRMAAVCAQYGVALLPYGVVCGGLLSEAYLNQPEPQPEALSTASLRKYRKMIDAWGGWELFQELLHVLKAIADEHGVRISTIAIRYILDKPHVAGVIVGARLGIADHYTENARVFDVTLTPANLAQIHAVTTRGRDLMAVIGDCGDEYRR